MRISPLLNVYEFACNSKACAPPPAGHGGSLKGGGKKGPAIRHHFNPKGFTPQKPHGTKPKTTAELKELARKMVERNKRNNSNGQLGAAQANDARLKAQKERRQKEDAAKRLKKFKEELDRIKAKPYKFTPYKKPEPFDGYEHTSTARAAAQRKKFEDKYGKIDLHSADHRMMQEDKARRAAKNKMYSDDATDPDATAKWLKKYGHHRQELLR